MTSTDYRKFCNMPTGERRLLDERLGFVGGNQINLFIETCGSRRLRFLVMSGIYFVWTVQIPTGHTRSDVQTMRNIALAWLRDTEEFANMSAYPQYDPEDELERVAS